MRATLFSKRQRGRSMRRAGWLTATALAALAFAALAQPATAQAPADPFAIAENAAARGDAPTMEQAYTTILAANPDDARALRGRATARSWKGDRTGARADFERVLAAKPDDVGALVGLGYDYLWGGEPAKAGDVFARALRSAPDDVGAAKGLAFAQLEAGQSHDAIASFQKLALARPGDVEVTAGLGRSHLEAGHVMRAERVFAQAGGASSTRDDVRRGLDAARGAPPALEIIAFGGNSVADSSSFDLRTLEIATWVNRETRLWARVDDSLSVDNPSLARSGQKATTYFVGGRTKLSKNWIGIAEAGTRDLPGGEDQQIYRVEGTRLISGARRATLGVQVSPNSAGFEDKLVYVGAGVPITRRIRGEATLYLAQSGAARDEEYRGVGYVEYASPKGWTLGVGAGAGQI